MLSKMLNEYELSQQYFVMYQVTLGSPLLVFVDNARDWTTSTAATFSSESRSERSVTEGAGN